jgi:uncharacterized membrane protein YidH (DUF202 family)
MENKHIAEIHEIRKMMESSSRFLSLSGLSGVFAGIIALLGATAAFFYLDYDKRYFDAYEFFTQSKSMKYREIALFLIIDGALMIVGALASAIYFTSRKAKRKGLPLWDTIAKRMIINLAIPLITGGLFALLLIYHQIIYLIAPSTLIFYGLALLNGSKYTYDDLRLLAISEIILGLIATFFIGYGLIFWALGFGVLHIIYGVVMYYKYER